MDEKPGTDARRGQRLSPRWFVYASIAFTAVTYYLLSLYGIAHWGLLSNRNSVEVALRTLDNIAEPYIPDGSNDKRYWQAIMEDAKRAIKGMNDAGWSLMKRTEIFRLTGLCSFIVSVLTFTRRPRRSGWIALPFGLAGIMMAMIVM